MPLLVGQAPLPGTERHTLRYPDMAGSPAEEPSGFETFNALMRSESFGAGVAGWFDQVDTPLAERVQAARQGWSANDETDRALAASPFWAGDHEAETVLRTATTPRQWAHSKIKLDKLYEDRTILSNSGTGTVLLQSLGMGLVDPVSLGFGLATGGGVPIARAIAYTGAKHASRELGVLSKAHKAAQSKMNRATKPVTKAKHRATMDALEGRMGFWANKSMRGPSQVVAAATGATTEAAFTEALLQKTQPGRTAEETMYNIFGAAAVSGLLSKGVGMYRLYVPKVTEPFLRRYEQERGMNAARILSEGDDSITLPGRDAELAETGSSPRAKYDIEMEMMISTERDAELRAEHGDDTVAYRDEKRKIMEKYTGVARKGLVKLVRALHPSARLATSDLVSHRLLGEALAQNDYVYNGVYEAGKIRQTAVETYIQHDVAQGTISTTKILDKGYDAVAKEIDTLRKSKAQKYFLGTNELYTRFKQEVMSDIIEEGYLREQNGAITFRDPDNPLAGMEKHIRATADELVATVLKPWEKRLIDAGLLSSDKIPVGHRAYLHRVWDKEMVTQYSSELKQIVRDSYYQQWENDVMTAAREAEADQVYSREEILAAAREGDEKLSAEFKKLKQQFDEMDAHAAEFVESIQGDQMGIAAIERLDPSAHKGMVSLLQRAPIPSARVKKFLVKDVGAVIQTWLRDVAPDYRLYEKFGPDYGTRLNALVADEATRLKEDLNAKIAAATDAKQKKALEKEVKRLIKDQEMGARAVTDIISVLRNRAGIPDNPDGFLNSMGKISRSLNFASKLGGMTISALTDLAYLVAKTGWRHAAPAIMKGVAGFGRLADNQRSLGSATFREFRSDAHITATVAENYMHSRMEAITMMEDIRGTGNLVDRSIHTLNTNFARVSFMNRWNDWVKSVSYAAYANKIKSHIDAGDMTRLAEFGISPDQAAKIGQAWATHGKMEGNTSVPYMREWHTSGADGIEAQDTMKYALLNAINSVVVTPGAGDIHMAMRHPMGKILTQFQTFPVAVMNRIVIPTLQKTSFKDPTPIMNLGMAIPLGMMVYILKELAAGREPTDDWDTLMYEGVQRSGIFGVYATGFNLMDDGTGGALSKALFGEDFEAPHRSRNPFTDALGPTVRLGEDAVKAYGGLHNMILNGEDMAWGEGSAIRRLIPGNNLFYLRIMGELSGTGGPKQWQESIMGQDAPD